MGTVMCCPFSFELRRESSSLKGTAYVFYDGTVACHPKASPVFKWLVRENFRQFTPICYNQTQNIFEKSLAISLCFDKPRHIDAYDAAQLCAMFPAQEIEPQLCKDDEPSNDAVFFSGTGLGTTFKGRAAVVDISESFVHPEAVALRPGFYNTSDILTGMADNVRGQIRGQNPKQVPDTPLFEFQWTSGLSELANQLFAHLVGSSLKAGLN
ncbi:hypothetical protein BFJ63_vAg17217 [Fusarium oxysporum f. sp. narcissi]|uniref:Uncharacterized protein n=1 Tax=Fusarium oxysporum f. sp. narcissi TaxID=451672 RepID=A0A4Q2V4S4_FUSOX|nr:hypothetical protein BFJ63_vAg17217 [Fusarium oxysporum f. sp. narcissi]